MASLLSRARGVGPESLMDEQQLHGGSCCLIIVIRCSHVFGSASAGGHPPFLREGASESSGGYGKKATVFRSSAARCLGSVLALNRAPNDWILNISEHQLKLTPASRLGELSS